MSHICFNYIRSLSVHFILPVIADVNAVSVFFKILLKHNSKQPGVLEFASTLLHSIQNKDNSVAEVLANFLKMLSNIERKEEKESEVKSRKHTLEKFFNEDREYGMPENNEELAKWFSELEIENSSLDDKKLQVRSIVIFVQNRKLYNIILYTFIVPFR